MTTQTSLTEGDGVHTWLFRVARHYAAQRGRTLRAAFDDSTSGDAARFHVFRVLRLLFPELPSDTLQELISDKLTP